MKAISKSAKKVMDILTEGLTNPGDNKKIDDAKGSFMAVHVELTEEYETGPVFSITHYYEQNSDLMRDPEMLFVRGFDGNYYPIYFRQDPYVEQFSVQTECKGGVTKITGVRIKMQADHAKFASMWMKNIREQQGI